MDDSVKVVIRLMIEDVMLLLTTSMMIDADDDEGDYDDDNHRHLVFVMEFVNKVDMDYLRRRTRNRIKEYFDVR